MAVLHAPRRPAVVLLLALAGAVLPTAVAPVRADTTTPLPIVQASPEIGVTSSNTAHVTATLIGDHPATPVHFHVIDPLPGVNADPPGCTAPASTQSNSTTSCSADIVSNQAGTSLIRVWIGNNPDLTEGRLANASPTPSGGILGGLSGDPNADCQPADNPDGGGLPVLGGGGGTSDICHTATDPNNNDQPDQVTPGDQPEGDQTDVVRVTWTSFTEGKLDCQDSHPDDGNGPHVQYKNSAAPDPSETYNCLLTTTTGAPIADAYIDGKYEAGSVDQTANSNTADLPSVCHTGSDGRCTQPFTVTMHQEGYDFICFWAKPAAQGNNPEDHSFNSSSTTNGKDCSAGVGLKPDSPIRNDITSVVYIDYGKPRAEGLDVQPENDVVAGPTKFPLRATVYDQFGNPFNGNTTIQAKVFAGSVLPGDNTVSHLDPNLVCGTNAGSTCTIFTAPQNDLGTDLACVWISATNPPGTTKAPTAMTGDASQENSTCTTHQELWQSAPDQEAHVDSTNDDGRPAPVTDGLDVVRFTVQSRPAIFTVTPSDRRQDTSGDVLTVDGINFMSLAKITVSGTGVNLGPTFVDSDKRLEASLAVAADAPPGARDVTVTNNDGGTTTCTGCFRVIGQGYWMVASDGGIFAFGDAPYSGSTGAKVLNKPIVAMAPTPTGLGYWLVSSDGGIFAFGDAPFVGSAGALSLAKPIASMAPTPSGRGYWLVSSDGGVFGYGDAKFYGATSKLTLSKPIVSIVATPTGRGYWLVASDGGVFNFGDAKFYGATGDLVLNQPIVAMAPTKTGKGYYLVASDGGVFAYGDATYYGSTGAIKLNKPIVGMTTTPLGKGYWMVATDGGIFAFGDAKFFGSTGGTPLNRPIVGLARR